MINGSCGDASNLQKWMVRVINNPPSPGSGSGHPLYSFEHERKNVERSCDFKPELIIYKNEL